MDFPLSFPVKISFQVFAPWRGRLARGLILSRTRCPCHAAIALACALLAGCHTAQIRPSTTPPSGDEIVVAGQRFHTGTRVVTWLEPEGYNAYRGAAPLELRQPNGLSAREAARVKARGWTLPTLQKVVDQFVVHYDAEGLSRICFDVLRKRPGLGVHFLLDVDGTIYQTLDLQERAAHATIANSRSIGIEIANIGAYPPAESAPLGEWYARDAQGGTIIAIPKKIREPGIRTRDFVGRPVRAAPVNGVVQGKALVQYDFTPEQYTALAKLTATLCRVFPRIACDAPRDASGAVLLRKLPDADFANHRGILGHFHIQENKVDPGPAFQWEAFLAETRRELR
ncbi:MAG TPA: peptidoglycan recognition family protein [Opitutaceae bacterium]|nr:peptidoglycan recognition family protein [Opitutaceae bacterium]